MAKRVVARVASAELLLLLYRSSPFAFSSINCTPHHLAGICFHCRRLFFWFAAAAAAALLSLNLSVLGVGCFVFLSGTEMKETAEIEWKRQLRGWWFGTALLPPLLWSLFSSLSRSRHLNWVDLNCGTARNWTAMSFSHLIGSFCAAKKQWKLFCCFN